MFNELPYYLQTLNTISTTPPSGTNDTENEDAIWKYLNTDDLFQNFGTQPSMFQPKEEIESPIVPSAPADLKSFIEQFAQDVPLPLPLPYNATASSSSAERKPTGVKTLDIMPPLSSTSVAESPSEDGGPSAAKKVKEWGPVMTDIEDDKRRRNTEASARFRAKKKEREHALDTRAKELEAQVAQLSADKASLQNENKLLKAIVLGGGLSQGQESLQATIQAFGAKRKRDQENLN